MGKIKEGRRQPYLSKDRNQIWACTTSALGEHPRQVSKNLTSGHGGDAMKNCLQKNLWTDILTEVRTDARQSPLWDKLYLWSS